MYILADIGGTNMRVAGSRDLRSFGESIVMSTPKNYDDGIAAIKDAAGKIARGAKIEDVVAGIRSVVSADGRTPTTASQNILRDWKDRTLAGDLEVALDSPRARLQNDTGLVGLGEAVFGAGKGARVVVYMTVSTGVNGARIVDGKLESGYPEIGGQYLRVGDVNRSLEDLISGLAISEKYGVHPREIDKDSPVWEELAEICAYGVHNAILHWSPERVVLGGSMFNTIGIPVDRVAFHVARIIRKFPTTPPIVHSTLGDLGGLWGGMAFLAREHA